MDSSKQYLHEYTRNNRTVYWTDGFLKQARAAHISQSIGGLPSHFLRALADWMTGQDKFWVTAYADSQELVSFVLADRWEIQFMPLTAVKLELTTVRRVTEAVLV